MGRGMGISVELLVCMLQTHSSRMVVLVLVHFKVKGSHLQAQNLRLGAYMNVMVFKKEIPRWNSPQKIGSWHLTSWLNYYVQIAPSLNLCLE